MPLPFWALFLVALFGSTIAQAKVVVPSYYAVIDSLTHRCFVMDKKPRADTRNITLVSDAIYESRSAAEAAIKMLNPCNH